MRDVSKGAGEARRKLLIARATARSKPGRPPLSAVFREKQRRLAERLGIEPGTGRGPPKPADLRGIASLIRRATGGRGAEPVTGDFRTPPSSSSSPSASASSFAPSPAPPSPSSSRAAATELESIALSGPVPLDAFGAPRSGVPASGADGSEEPELEVDALRRSVALSRSDKASAASALSAIIGARAGSAEERAAMSKFLSFVDKREAATPEVAFGPGTKDVSSLYADAEVERRVERQRRKYLATQKTPEQIREAKEHNNALRRIADNLPAGHEARDAILARTRAVSQVTAASARRARDEALRGSVPLMMSADFAPKRDHRRQTLQQMRALRERVRSARGGAGSAGMMVAGDARGFAQEPLFASSSSSSSSSSASASAFGMAVADSSSDSAHDAGEALLHPTAFGDIGDLRQVMHGM